MSKRIALAAATLVIAVLLLFVYPHRTDAQTTEAKARTPEELSRYIDQMGNSYRVGDSYGKAQKYLTQADVPVRVYVPDINDRSVELVIDPGLCIPTQEHGNE